MTYNISTTEIVGLVAIWQFLDRMCEIRDAYIKAHIKD